MTARRLCVRVAQLAVASALTLSVAACTCPPPDAVEQTFVLDGTDGTPLELADAGFGPARDAGGDAASTDATSSDAVMSPFRGTPGSTPSAALDCASTAAGCAPDGDCPAACACVLMRARIYDGTVKRCTLLAGAAAPQVRVGYTVPVFCGGD